MVPSVHLNGTSGDELLEQVTEASTAVRAAIRALDRAAPNARDYYVQGDDAFERARAEHAARYAKLQDVAAELYAIAEDISDQIDEQRTRRAVAGQALRDRLIVRSGKC